MTVTIPEKDLKIIIQGDDPIESANLTIKWGKQLGESLASNGLTTSQIRNIFSEVRRIEMRWTPDETSSEQAKKAEYDFILLQAKTAYQLGKETNHKKQEVLKELIDNLQSAMRLARRNNRDDFQRFVDLFEAILAYHKAAGGRD